MAFRDIMNKLNPGDLIPLDFLIIYGAHPQNKVAQHTL